MKKLRGLSLREFMPRLRGAAQNDDGMATAEYAMVTVAAAAFAGVLIVLIKSPQVRDLLMGVITSVFGG